MLDSTKIHLLLTHGQYLLVDTANNTNMLKNQASCSSVHLVFHCIRQKNGIMSQTEVNLSWPLKLKMHSLKPDFLFKPVLKRSVNIAHIFNGGIDSSLWSCENKG